MRRTARLLLALALQAGCVIGSGPGDGGVIAAMGCSNVAIQGSCSAAGQGCVEYGGLPSTSGVAQSCASNGGTFSSSGCSRGNAVGGCQKALGTTCFTTWYYASSGISSMQAQSTCESQQGTFLLP
jgi:hypothetical protein